MRSNYMVQSMGIQSYLRMRELHKTLLCIPCIVCIFIIRLLSLSYRVIPSRLHVASVLHLHHVAEYKGAVFLALGLEPAPWSYGAL